MERFTAGINSFWRSNESPKLETMEVEFSQIQERQVEDADNVDSSIIIVVPGEVITTEPGFLK